MVEECCKECKGKGKLFTKRFLQSYSCTCYKCNGTGRVTIDTQPKVYTVIKFHGLPDIAISGDCVAKVTEAYKTTKIFEAKDDTIVLNSMRRVYLINA
jgi:hypothetical protein